MIGHTANAPGLAAPQYGYSREKLHRSGNNLLTCKSAKCFWIVTQMHHCSMGICMASAIPPPGFLLRLLRQLRRVFLSGCPLHIPAGESRTGIGNGCLYLMSLALGHYWRRIPSIPSGVNLVRLSSQYPSLAAYRNVCPFYCCRLEKLHSLGHCSVLFRLSEAVLHPQSERPKFFLWMDKPFSLRGEPAGKFLFIFFQGCNVF